MILPPTADDIRVSASQAASGSPIIQNNLRALVVEAIVDAALRPSWRWCSVDWAGWDFEHETGIKLEVKQSAVRQTWAAPKSKLVPRFDIRERTGYWEDGATWIAQPGRNAQIYVFAHHPFVDETADHRDPLQWRFYVIRASVLPVARTIGLPGVNKLAPQPVSWAELFGAVEQVRLLLGVSAT